jgi:hypothetical protein
VQKKKTKQGMQVCALLALLYAGFSMTKKDFKKALRGSANKMLEGQKMTFVTK